MFDLYAITPERSPAEIERSVARALAHEQAARIAVQLRGKHLPRDERLSLGRALRAITKERGARLLISGELDLCEALGADGVQLPELGPSVELARRTLPAERLIGASRHDAAGLARAAREGASFATLSPIYASPGKGTPLGESALASLAKAAALPVFALGGVEPRHVAALISAGAAGVAVIRGLLEDPDPCAAARSFLDAIDEAGRLAPPKASARDL